MMFSFESDKGVQRRTVQAAFRSVLVKYSGNRRIETQKNYDN